MYLPSSVRAISFDKTFFAYAKLGAMGLDARPCRHLVAQVFRVSKVQPMKGIEGEPTLGST
jgi:hypothetical protein